MDDTLAREKAKSDAFQQGRQPSSQELDQAVETAKLGRRLEFENIHAYYRSNAFPNYWQIALTLGVLTALAGAVMVLVGWAPKRALKETADTRS